MAFRYEEATRHQRRLRFVCAAPRHWYAPLPLWQERDHHNQSTPYQAYHSFPSSQQDLTDQVLILA